MTKTSPTTSPLLGFAQLQAAFKKFSGTDFDPLRIYTFDFEHILGGSRKRFAISEAEMGKLCLSALAEIRELCAVSRTDNRITYYPAVTAHFYTALLEKGFPKGLPDAERERIQEKIVAATNLAAMSNVCELYNLSCENADVVAVIDQNAVLPISDLVQKNAEFLKAVPPRMGPEGSEVVRYYMDWLNRQCEILGKRPYPKQPTTSVNEAVTIPTLSVRER